MGRSFKGLAKQNLKQIKYQEWSFQCRFSNFEHKGRGKTQELVARDKDAVIRGLAGSALLHS